MTSSRPDLLFTENFDLPGNRPALPAPVEPPPPVFDQADIDAAVARGHEAGHAAGLAAAAAARAAAVADTIATIAESLANSATIAERVAEDSAAAMLDMLMEAIAVGYPMLRARHGETEVREMIRTLRQGLESETRVTVEVHPTLVAAVEQELAAMPRSARQRVVIEPLDAMPPGDARVEWPDGAAIRDTEGVWKAIAGVLEPLGMLPAGKPQREITEVK